MCTALEELKKEFEIKGEIRGEIKGEIKGRILTYFEFGLSPEETAKKMGITVNEVEKVLEENGKLNRV